MIDLSTLVLLRVGGDEQQFDEVEEDEAEENAERDGEGRETSVGLTFGQKMQEDLAQLTSHGQTQDEIERATGPFLSLSLSLLVGLDTGVDEEREDAR